MLNHVTKLEMRRILEHQVDALEREGFANLWPRFTDSSRGFLSKKARPMAKGEEIVDVRGPSGMSYEVEIGVSVEHERDLHFFISVIDGKTGESIGADTVVKRP